MDLDWVPFLVTIGVLLVVFVITFTQHTIIQWRQERARPSTPGTPKPVPEEVAWYLRRNPSSRGCVVLLLLWFPGLLIYFFVWAISTAIVFRDTGDDWQAPGWWTGVQTVVLLGGALCYVFQPWKYLERTRAHEAGEYPDDWDDLRSEIYARDGYACMNCGATDTELHAHHIVPLSVGGTNATTNLVTLCRACHQRIHPHMRD